MTGADEYQGWTNRETWALHLHLSNDQGLYELTRERVADRLASNSKFMHSSDSVYAARVAGEAVKDLFDELTDPAEFNDSDLVLTMLREVGSVWRVNFDEVGAAFIEDLS